MSINRVSISGNLTRDPELRTTQGGMQILTFGVAVNERRKDPQSGEWKDYPNFIDCVMFGRRAESLSNLLSKGSKVALDGKLRWSQWEKDGSKRSKVEVIVDEVELMGQPKAKSADNDGHVTNYTNQSSNASYSGSQRHTGASSQVDVYDEDIPF